MMKIEANNKRTVLEDKSGFTLIEFIIVIVIMGVIASILAVMILAGVNAFHRIAVREALITEAEAAMERMTREARYLTAIIEAEESKFHFTYFDDSDIKYMGSTSGSALLRNGRILAGNLSSVTFRYLDGGGEPVAGGNYEDIRAVEIELVLSKGGQDVELESRVRPRNF